MEKWEEGFYITAMAGSNSGWSLVAMSKGTPYTQQSYKVGAPLAVPMIMNESPKKMQTVKGTWGVQCCSTGSH